MNGKIFSIDPSSAEASERVSVFDRGYLYGDSLYEVVRTYHQKFYLLDDHLKRLKNSANLARMTLPQGFEDTLLHEIHRTHAAFLKVPKNANQEAYLRVIVSRGVGKIGFSLKNLQSSPLFMILIQPLEQPSAQQFEQGMKVQISSRLRNHPRALDPAMKSGNYLNSVLAFLDAQEAGYDDALLCNSEGFLTEGTTFNLFYVRRGILATPPLPIGILEGITRAQVLRLADSLGIPFREVYFKPEQLLVADEVFLSSSIREVFPISQVGEKKIAQRGVGSVTRRLSEAYRLKALQTSERMKS
ncbi:MAG: aminotransferase class IV [Bdellovibrionia bacterium]